MNPTNRLHMLQISPFLSKIIDSDTAAYDEYLGLIQKYMVSPP